MVNALEMLSNAKHPYILLWNEDHLNIAPQAHLMKVVEEMAEHKAEYLQHSWFQNGKYRKQFEMLPLRRGKTIDSVHLDRGAWKKVLAAGHKPQLISLLGIFEKDFLVRLLHRDRTKFPLSFTRSLYRAMTLIEKVVGRFNQKEWFRRINRTSGFKFRAFSDHEAPHDVEKTWERFDILPIREAFTHQELFVCIDDDDDPNDPYSLMTRGLYPMRDILMAWNSSEILPKHSPVSQSLAAGESIKEAYCFFSAKNVRHHSVREYIKVEEGEVRISMKGEERTLKSGEGAGFFANIPHEIVALVPSKVTRFLPETGLARHDLVA
jgi:mannose-6-phosphate isomerase-like protein (cupin superfamily)